MSGDLLTLVFFLVDFDATVSLVRTDRYEYYHLGRSHHLTPSKLKQAILLVALRTGLGHSSFILNRVVKKSNKDDRILGQMLVYCRIDMRNR